MILVNYSTTLLGSTRMSPLSNSGISEMYMTNHSLLDFSTHYSEGSL